VALAGYGERRSTGAANVACDQSKVVDGSDSRCALGGVVDSHRPSDESCFSTSIQRRHFFDLRNAETSNLGDMLWGELHDKRFQFAETVGVLLNVVAVDQAIANENVCNAVDERDVTARLDWKVNVRHHRGL